MALAPAQPVLGDDPRELAALAQPNAVAQEEAGAAARGEDRLVALARVGDGLELQVGEGAAELVGGRGGLEEAGGKREVERDGRQLGEGERGGLDHRVRVRLPLLVVEGHVGCEGVLGVLVHDGVVGVVGRRLLGHLALALLRHGDRGEERSNILRLRWHVACSGRHFLRLAHALELGTLVHPLDTAIGKAVLLLPQGALARGHVAHVCKAVGWWGP